MCIHGKCPTYCSELHRNYSWHRGITFFCTCSVQQKRNYYAWRRGCWFLWPLSGANLWPLLRCISLLDKHENILFQQLEWYFLMFVKPTTICDIGYSRFDGHFPSTTNVTSKMRISGGCENEKCLVWIGWGVTDGNTHWDKANGIQETLWERTT